jgi:hypothetical protein
MQYIQQQTVTEPQFIEAKSITHKSEYYKSPIIEKI